MKELPQINVSTTSKAQFLKEFSEVGEDIPGGLVTKKFSLSKITESFRKFFRKGTTGRYKGWNS